jgi:hypothetical protein
VVAAPGPRRVGAAHPARLPPPLAGPLPDPQRRQAAGEGPHRASWQHPRAGVPGEGGRRAAGGGAVRAAAVLGNGSWDFNYAAGDWRLPTWVYRYKHNLNVRKVVNATNEVVGQS